MHPYRGIVLAAFAGLGLALALALSACSGSDPTATPVPTATPIPTATPVPTATPTPAPDTQGEEQYLTALSAAMQPFRTASETVGQILQ